VHTTLLAKSSDGANTAYEVGGFVFVAVLLILGVTLLILGLKGRKANNAAPLAWQPPPPPAPPAYGEEQPAAPDFFEKAPAADSWSTPPPPPDAWGGGPAAPPAKKKSGVLFIVAGALLTAFAIIGGIGFALGLNDDTRDRTEVKLPATLLGLTRNDTGLETAKTQLASSLPKGFDESDVGFYGTRPNGIVVVAGRGTIRSPESEITGFRKGVAGSTDGKIGDGEKVDAGPLGGEARCFDTTVAGGTHVDICVFVDKGSIMASFDFVAKNVQQAAGRALTIRSAVIQRTAS
jgi:hypothetical protein